jgi:dTDP-4-amino-4,6-dideoxygalactose transaminase
MTTQLRDKPAVVKPRPEPLAVDGGPRTVGSPYKESWRATGLRDAWRIFKLLRRGRTTLATADGPVGEFERAFAGLTGCQYALAMNSGTAALHSGLFAVGVGPGDEVILPSYTWHATASAVLCCGATPVFCDVNPRTLTADPADMQRRITPRTKALLPVHVWGNPAEMDAVKAVADRHRLAVVEDCSHAHGATYQGKPVGAWGDVGCFSLQGTKAVSAGEGGVAVCNRRDYFARMLALGHPLRAGEELKADDFGLGQMHLGPKYRPHLFGVVLAFGGLARLPRLNQLRRRNWQILVEELVGAPGVTPVEALPGAQRGGFLEFKFILDPERLTCTADEFLATAKAEGVPATPDRYGTLHTAAVFHHGGPLTLASLTPAARNGAALQLPHTDGLRDRVITLPAFTDVPEKFVRQCGAALRKVAEHRAR